ncbi:UxaA family hydrolase [Polycladidibacter hongkongensis]|uniref:UxaA family hydrolase n=1 Tax=Polycladidibacter hongkongensis TaxID=1647556 RepID=UPI000835B2B6|nr:UxaA family hydrolase [Pseudovibrio hongkongensis]
MQPNGFSGYERVSGLPGVRNHLLVLNATGLTAPTARRVHSSLAGSVLASTPYGMGMIGDDLESTERALLGFALHPNNGALLIISADRPRCDRLSEVAARSGRPFYAICLDEVDHDCLTLTDRAIRAGARLLHECSGHKRREFPLSALRVGLECGLSDPTSGLAANPLLGAVSDHLVTNGAQVILGETLEWLGTERQLAARAKDDATGKAIIDAVKGLEFSALDAGIDLLGINPNAANIRGGLSTIEEKASGSAAKAGSSQIQSLLKYGEAPQSPGLHLMNAASYTPESLSGFCSAGAQLNLFTTGLGNSYVSALAPTIKISANDGTCRRLLEQIDFDASALLLDSSQSLEAVTQDLVGYMCAVASGASTYGEILKEGDETISRFGAAL